MGRFDEVNDGLNFARLILGAHDILLKLIHLAKSSVKDSKKDRNCR